MHQRLSESDRLGLLHPAIDIHTLGIASVSQLLDECGILNVIAGHDVCQYLETCTPGNELLVEWVKANSLTALGFSYRLDPGDGVRSFRLFSETLTRCRLRENQGGPIRAVFFAGLPATCEAVSREFPEVAVFEGDETPGETLQVLGLSPSLIPVALAQGVAYDESRWSFAAELIRLQNYRDQRPVRRSYPTYGLAEDLLVERLADGRRAGHPPVMRAHVGAYLPDRQEAVALNLRWAQALAASGYLDVLSVGSSQLTQSDFFRDWGAKSNGGGVPLQTEAEFSELWSAARPLLVRAYSGTRDVVRVAQMLEDNLHIAWHALSLWWFCQLDGRGPNPVRQNLQEHWDALCFIARSGKPFEPNIPHHFAFRGGDDISYVVSGYLAARLAQKAGIRDFVLQIMLNTPKTTWGVQDLAKARALLRLVRSLESPQFRVYLQPRGGLDYFSPNAEKAKIQLAAVTALMADIEPDDPHSPPLIHVVSYSEALHLADPAVVDESIQITRQALQDWRAQKAQGKVPDVDASGEVERRTVSLLSDAQQMIAAIEKWIPDPYSPEGLYQVLVAGFFPLPSLWLCRDEFPRALEGRTKLHNGGVVVVDEEGLPLPMAKRLERIASGLQVATRAG